MALPDVQPLPPLELPTSLDDVAHDRQLRAKLKDYLARTHPAAKPLVVDELGLSCGTVRADVAVVAERLEGFEIKAGHDTLTRLAKQMQAYDQTFERCWLVTVERHEAKVRALVPSWWGILLALPSQDLVVSRQAKDNVMLEGKHIAGLLWREEALSLLDKHGLLKGYKTKPKRALFARLADGLSLPVLAAEVRVLLRARTDWRDTDGSSLLLKKRK